MARYETIETNPTALRHIASDIRSYTACQVGVVQDFLNIISAEEDEITTAAFQEAIERIRFRLRQMEQLKEESDQFAAYLCDRAEKIDAMDHRH